MEQKKKYNRFIYLVVITILLMLLSCLGGYIIAKNNVNNKPKNNNSEVLTASEKKEILDMVGLTENGYPKEKCTEIDPECNVDINDLWGLQHYLFFVDKVGDISLDELNNNAIIQLVYNYAFNHNLLTNISITDDDFTCDGRSMEECTIITPDTYLKIAKIFNMTKDGKNIFEEQIYKGNYYFTNPGWTIYPASLQDSIKFSKNEDDILVTYKAKVKTFDDDNPINKDQTYTYTFKKDSSNNYYIDNINIKNN